MSNIYVPRSGGKAIVLVQHTGRTGGTGRHLAYLERDGVGEDGGRGQLFTAEDRDIDPDAFRYQASHDISQYRLVVSPWSRGEHMQEFTRDFMEQVNRDLGRDTDWCAATHHNTEHAHAHVVIRDVDREGRHVEIPERYQQQGMKDRASEVEYRFDREHDAALAREGQRLHRSVAEGPQDRDYQAELRERLQEIRSERLEMRQFERDEGHSPGRQRAQALIERVQRDREERGYER